MSFKNIRFKRTGLALSSRKIKKKLGLRLGKKIKKKIGLGRVTSAGGLSSGNIYGPTGSIVGRY